MRFKKGSKVEVLSYSEVPSGEWRCAEIISGNGHTYSVQYNCSSMTSEAMVERVPRKAIRPCPPLVKGVDSWSADDIVEVYHAGCWKGAIVLKFLGGNIYLVRLLGSCKESEIHKFNMRVRQCWQDDQWVVMQKGSGNSGVGKCRWNMSSNSYKMNPEAQQAGTERKQQAGNNCFPGLDGSGVQESCQVSSATLKRVSPYYYSPIEAYPRKVRAIMNKGECQRFIAVSEPPLLEKVDAIAYPHENMGEKRMHGSFNNGANQYYEMGKVNPNNVTANFLERNEEPNDSCSDMCSVGSCSAISNPYKFSSDMLAGPCQDADILCSDAESLDVGDEDEKCPFSPKEDVAAKIHRLELHAYRSTLEAMYASGSLTWEQEALLTNLRILLHISNDEDLLEIRNLISTGQRF